jgi:tetratricopeptide (TPR) repeat protein
MKREVKKYHLSHLSLILFILIAIGALIRFTNLGNIILYWDEPIHCVRIASQPFPWVIAHNDASAFFALLVHILLPLGKVELMARIPAALAGILAIYIVYLLGKTLSDMRTGILAAAFVTFSPLLIQYSQYSRMYATYLLFSTLSAYFFYRAITEDKTRYWVGYSFSTVFHVYNHLFGLFLMPVFGLFTLFIWIQDGIKKRKTKPKPFHPKKPVKFIMWTLLAFLVITLLYIPDTNLHKFIKDVFGRATTQTQDSPITLFYMDSILLEQFKANGMTFFFLFLGLVLIGFVISSFKRSRVSIFSILYILIPYVLFILIKPNEATFLSAFRYFLFFLPLFYIFMAKSILWLASTLTKQLKRIKVFPTQANSLSFLAAGCLMAVIILFGFNLKEYYTKYWRLGTLRIDDEVTDFLENNVTKDGLIYFENSLISSKVLFINPLTKDLVYDEVEYIIRKRMKAPEGKKPIMIYEVEPNLLKYYSRMKADLWIVIPKGERTAEPFNTFIRNNSDIGFYPLKKNIILSFRDTRQPLSAKLITAIDILQTVNPSGTLKKEHHYVQARNHLLAGDFSRSSLQLELALKTEPSYNSLETERIPFIHHVLDSLFGLDSEKLSQNVHQQFHEAIAHLFLFHGDALRNEGDFQNALKAFDYCTDLSTTYNEHISIRLKNLAKSLFRNGQAEEAIPFFKRMLEKDQDRADIRYMLAEALKQNGNIKAAEEAFKTAFGNQELPVRFLQDTLDTKPLLMIWKNKKRWHFTFRAQSLSFFNGKISTKSKIKALRKGLIGRNDSLKTIGRDIYFKIRANKGLTKIFSLELRENTLLTIDVKVNNHRRVKNIFFVNRGKSPEAIPFSFK